MYCTYYPRLLRHAHNFGEPLGGQDFRGVFSGALRFRGLGSDPHHHRHCRARAQAGRKVGPSIWTPVAVKTAVAPWLLRSLAGPGVPSRPRLSHWHYQPTLTLEAIRRGPGLAFATALNVSLDFALSSANLPLLP